METYTVPQLEKFLRIHLRSIQQKPFLEAGQFYHGRALSSTIDFCRAWVEDFRPQTKECYYNAASFALDHQDQGVRYAEGYWFDPEASTYLYHAWNVLLDGRVIDFTQEAADGQLEREPTLDCLYFGIEIPTDFVRAQIAKTGCARNYAWLYLSESTPVTPAPHRSGPI